MGGSSSGGPFLRSDPEKLKKQIRHTEERTADAAFETSVNETLTQLLAHFNNRDVALVNDRLNAIKELIEGEIEETVDTLLGGSVAKHTYVDGLSDIDSLLIVDDTKYKDAKPRLILAALEEILRKGLGTEANVNVGRIAVTVSYPDGMQIQLLPARRSEEGLRVPAWRLDGWSAIEPEKFQRGLTKRNAECNGKLIPTVKLVKAINSTLPDDVQLTGYHVESLAIAAFRGYEGPRTFSRMLPHFFEKAKDLVLAPIADRTGQSVHVDEYLGDANSAPRHQVSHLLARIGKRIKNAMAAKSQEQWRALFGE